MVEGRILPYSDSLGNVILGFLKRFLSRERSSSHEGCDRKAERTVLLVTSCSSEQNTLRSIAILERWRLLVAPSLDGALRILQEEPVTIVLYDRDMPAMHWQQGIRVMLRHNPSVCLIMLSPVAVEPLRSSVIAAGGYDVACKPVDRITLIHMVNGYWVLEDSINALPQAEPRR